MASTKKCDWCGKKIHKWNVIPIVIGKAGYNFCSKKHLKLMRAYLDKIKQEVLDFKV